MSDGADSNPNKIQAEPLKSIGAQDLIKVDYKICGHLRKQPRLKLFGSKKWNLKFIVLSQGCVYCFNNEHSESPVSAFSLCVYETVTEMDSATMPHSFEIIPEEKGKRTHIFACETEEKRKEWISCIDEVLQQCRQYLGKLSADSGIDDGIPSKKSSRRNLPPLPTPPGQTNRGQPKKYKETKSEYDLESEEEEEPDSNLDPYDDVDLPCETAPSPPQAMSPKSSNTVPRAGHVQVLPIPPGLGSSSPLSRTRPKTLSDRPPVALPTARKPESDGRGYINNSIFEETEYVFNSVDRSEALSLIELKPEGTFLIRNGRSEPFNKVLTVMTEIGIKEFKITEKDSKVSLDNKDFFPAISALLTFYNQNNLPKAEYNTKLLKGYKSDS